MSSALHSMNSDSWLTPLPIVEMAWEVLGGIDLDPCTSKWVNKTRVMAGHFLDEQNDGLSAPWFGSVFINPPGGRRGRATLPQLFWEHLLKQDGVTHAVFLAYSISFLRTSQAGGGASAANFPFCVPKKRICFDRPDGSPSKHPSHDNIIIYLPGTVDRTEEFGRVFSAIGAVVNV